jgi:hypothetical protein
MKKYIRKADIILLIVLVVIGLAASAALSMSRTEAGKNAKVVIESNGKTYAEYSLYTDTTVTVPAPKQNSADNPEHYNVVTIKGGEVSVTEASCKNQVCVKHGSISHTGETIVCLPNRLLVRIVDPEGGGYDAVTS